MKLSEAWAVLPSLDAAMNAAADRTGLPLPPPAGVHLVPEQGLRGPTSTLCCRIHLESPSLRGHSLTIDPFEVVCERWSD